MSINLYNLADKQKATFDPKILNSHVLCNCTEKIGRRVKDIKCEKKLRKFSIRVVQINLLLSGYIHESPA